MSQSLEKLQQLVSELETELSGVEATAPETRELLRRLAMDVERALAQPSESLSGGSWLDRLKESARDMESSHPQLAGMLNQVIDALAHIGI
ncbi:MAG: DUF4404 family protein [Pirellulales bacterium]